MVSLLKNRDELISSVPADKVFRIYRKAKLFGKGTDIFVSLVMSQIVVDDSQVIQIKHTDGCTLFFSERCGIAQDLFAFVFVRQPCGFIQIDFLSQDPVLCRKAECPKQFHTDQKYQADNVCNYNLFKMIQCSRSFL